MPENNENLATNFADRAGFKASFPMYVLPVREVLKLDRFLQHEQLKDKLVEAQDGMKIVFVSQTWLTHAHNDNAANDKCVRNTIIRDSRMRWPKAADARARAASRAAVSASALLASGCGQRQRVLLASLRRPWTGAGSSRASCPARWPAGSRWKCT